MDAIVINAEIIRPINIIVNVRLNAKVGYYCISDRFGEI